MAILRYGGLLGGCRDLHYSVRCEKSTRGLKKGEGAFVESIQAFRLGLYTSFRTGNTE